MDYREAGVDISAADAAKARIKGLAKAHLQRLRAHRDRLLRRDVPPRPLPLPRAGARGLDRRRRHQDQGGDRWPASTTPSATTSWPTASTTSSSRGRCRSSSSTTSRSAGWTRVKVEQIVSGFARACAEFGCPLIGGETAEMPGTYAEDDYDLAGFIVGRGRAREGARRAACARATSSWACPRRASTRTATRSPARCSSRRSATASTRTSPSSAPRSARRCSPRTAATSPPSSRCSSATRCGRSPTSPAAASPATSRACCPTGLGRAAAAGLVGGAAPLPPHPDRAGAVADEEM